MKKYEYLRELAGKLNVTHGRAKEISDIIGEIVISHMNDDDGISPFAGVRFLSSFREKRSGVNPRTGESITIDSKYIPKVKFGKYVKQKINSDK